MAQIDFKRELNPEQLAAATAPDGPLFVLAAAGTGKTRTLVYRVAYLLSRGVDPRRLLLLTFTNRAAKEMLTRAEALVNQGVGGMWGGTFHHMANRILRRTAHLIGYSNDFTILDADDSRTLMRECLTELKLKSREFPKPEVLLALFSTANNRRLEIEEVVRARFEHYPVEEADIMRVYQRYISKKTEQNLMDFDDLLLNALRLFHEQESVLEYYREQFLYIMVDEYQDTNSIQADLVDQLASKHRNLLVVGDDFQSIYAWRGADYRNIMSFPKRYPDARMYKLETNYRSVPEILEVANCCIAGNPRQFSKVLRPIRPAHHRPVLARLRDGDHQARYIIDQLHQRHRAGTAWRSMAVLYRAHHHAMELQMALAREHIPYIVTSGVRFFEQAHIKDVCAFLRVLHNPEDILAFKRLFGMLPGVGPKTCERLWLKLGNRFEANAPEARATLLKSLPASAQPLWLAVQPVVEKYFDEQLADDPGEAIALFIKAFYEKYALDTYEDSKRRIEDIREMILFTAEFESTADFLNEVALVTNVDAENDVARNHDRDCLRLSTVHQAKGLEWETVFIIWAADGMFPSARSMEDFEGEEEERRLFYVAVTRAKDNLTLCVPETRRGFDGSVNFFMPSRFISEIPPDKLDAQRIGFV